MLHQKGQTVLLNAGYALSSMIPSGLVLFVKLKASWSSPSFLNNTKMHSRKFLTIIPSIIDHML